MSAMSTVLHIVEASSAPHNYIARPRPHSSQEQLSQMTEECSCSRKTFGHILAACEWGNRLEKGILEKKQLQNPTKPGFFNSPPQAPIFFFEVFPRIFWILGENHQIFSHHISDPGGKILYFPTIFRTRVGNLKKLFPTIVVGKKIPLMCPKAAYS